ncbi:MAG: 50S ribosomal protein L6 [Bacteroidetes bacterium]|nr:50S ribosomal protein L6 [Bacteroidota bacterium]MCH8246325.1 50S ribosomal protein L6 [Bacteroidota bacterium]
MSRVGYLPITILDGVTVDIGSNNLVTVKGPKGELSLQVDPDIMVEMGEGDLLVKRPTEQKRHKSLHGLYRSLLDGMITGVTEGFRRELEVIGVGYRAIVENGVLELALGYSHSIFFVPPEGVDISVDIKRGKNTFIIVDGIDKQKVGQVAAKIRSLRPPEPYKGKGVRYVDEYVRRKAGKTAAG